MRGSCELSGWCRWFMNIEWVDLVVDVYCVGCVGGSCVLSGLWRWFMCIKWVVLVAHVYCGGCVDDSCEWCAFCA